MKKLRLTKPKRSISGPRLNRRRLSSKRFRLFRTIRRKIEKGIIHIQKMGEKKTGKNYYYEKKGITTMKKKTGKNWSLRIDGFKEFESSELTQILS